MFIDSLSTLAVIATVSSCRRSLFVYTTRIAYCCNLDVVLTIQPARKITTGTANRPRKTLENMRADVVCL